MVRLLLFILVNALKHAIHLLLEQEFKFLNHEFIDRAALNEVSHKTLYSVALVNYDSLNAKVGYIDVYVELGFTIVAALNILIVTAIRIL